MRKQMGLGVVGVVLIAACLGATASSDAQNRAAAHGSDSAVPGAVDISALKMKIVGAAFVTEYDGGIARYKESQPDKYHGVVVTLRITKPKGMALSLNAADLPLHYTRGTDHEVAPCHGLSAFSTCQDHDRPMTIGAAGFVKTSTRLATTSAEEVYVDCFYQGMESDTDEMHILVAQPTGAAGFRTEGW